MTPLEKAAENKKACDNASKLVNELEVFDDLKLIQVVYFDRYNNLQVRSFEPIKTADK